MSSRRNLDALLVPGSIAVIGASGDLDRIGGVPLKLLMESGFRPVYAVNPKYDHIQDIACFPSIEQVSEVVDLAVVATAACDVLEQLERAYRTGVRAAIVFASGFAETGEPAAGALQTALTAFAHRTGMAISGPNCIGVVNWSKRVFATFARAFPPALPAGRVALLGQSGNVSSTIFRAARRLNLTFSHAISTGNEACLNISDYLAYLAEEPGVDAALCYLEALRDGRGFIAAARRFRAQGKLLAVYKAGNSAKGAEAAQSHTAALAGDRTAYDTAFRHCGVAVAEDLIHLADLAYMHGFRGRRIGPRVAIMSVSGAAGAIISDGLSARNMTIPSLPAPAQAELRNILPAFGMAANPVDLTGNVANQSENVGAVIALLTSAEPIDVLLVYMGGRSLIRSLPQLAQIARRTDKLIIIVDTFESGVRAEVEALGIPFFEDIAQAVRALATYCAWARTPIDEVAPPKVVDPILRMNLTAAAAQRSTTSLSEIDAKSILAAAGIPVVQDVVHREQTSLSAAAERIGYPVVLKLVSPDVRHKTEIEAVRVGLRTRRAVEAAYRAILENAAMHVPGARVHGIAVEPYVEGTQELLVGITRDAAFGMMMTVGLGGIWTELLQDVSHALLPVDVRMARDMLSALKGFPLLQGYRGAPAADIAAAAHAIASLSTMALAMGDDMVSCEINPLLVLPDGNGVIAADAMITLSHAPVQAPQ